MGCWDIYCFICGNPCYSNKYKWMNNATLLLENNKIIHGAKETSCNTDFKYKKETYDASLNLDAFSYFSKFYTNRCVFLHTDCWKFIKNEYKIELKYSNLPFSQIDYDIGDTIGDVNYKPISKYHEQFFDYEMLEKDKNLFMILSPLDTSILGKKNISRIKKIVSQFKFRFDPSRKSPSVSATFYKNGSIKMGNNNKFWIKEKGKWVPLKEQEKILKVVLPKKVPSKLSNIINKIPQLGKYNDEFIFVKSFKLVSKGTEFEFIGSEKILNKYFKKNK